MTSLENAPIRIVEDEIINNAAIFYIDPTKFPYVREGNSVAMSPNYKPCKNTHGELSIGKKVKFTGEIYKITFWYLKSYDLTMPDERETKHGGGYYWWGKNDDGTNRKNESPTIIPTEGVIFKYKLMEGKMNDKKRIEDIKEIILFVIKVNYNTTRMKTILLSDVINETIKVGKFTEDEVKRGIDSLKRSGQIFEPREGYVCLI